MNDRAILSALSNLNAIWDKTTVTMIGAKMAYALDEKRKRKEAEAQQRAQVQAEVDAKNAALEAERQAKWQAQKIQNWLEGQATLNAYLEEAKKQGAGDTEIAKLKQTGATMGLGEAISEAEAKVQTLYVQNVVRQQALENFRAREHDTSAAEAWQEQKQPEDLQAGLAAYYNARKQGEQESETNWWEKIMDFAQEKIVQPVRVAIASVASPAPSVPVPALHRAKLAPVPTLDDDPPPWPEFLKEKWEKTKQWVNTNVVQPAKIFVKKTLTTAKETYEAIKRNVKQKWEDGKEWIADTWKNSKQWVNSNVIRPVKETVKTIVNDAVAFVKGIPAMAATFIDMALDYTYEYHGPVNLPTGVTSQLWMPLPGISSSTPQNFILDNFRVNQEPINWPSPNECVTAATIQDINMIQDILADKFGLPQLPHMDLLTFAAAFDAQGPLMSILRPPADVTRVGGMLPPQSAVVVLEGHSNWLREKYGCGYSVELTSGNTVDDLITNLQKGYPTSIHISQDVDLFKVNNGKVTYQDWRTLIGGVPHTATLAGYDATTDTWFILDPSPYKSTSYTTWNTQQLIDHWGRQFVGYPPRFAMTTLIPDTTCTLPSLTSTPIPTIVPTPPTLTGTSLPSQTPQPPNSVQVEPTSTLSHRFSVNKKMQLNKALSSRKRLRSLLVFAITCLVLVTACCYGIERAIFFPPETQAPKIFPDSEIIFSTLSREVGFVNADGTHPEYIRLIVDVHGNTETIWPWRPVIAGDNQTLIVRPGDDVYFGSGTHYLALWRTGAFPLLCSNWLYQQKPLLTVDQRHIIVQVERDMAIYTLDSCATEKEPVKVYRDVFGTPSPDLKLVAYAKQADDLYHNRSIAVRDISRGEELIIGEGDFPVWSRDGQWLAYTGVDGIYIVNMLIKTDPIRVVLYQNPVDAIHYPAYSNINQIQPPEPAWSPDGQWLVYHKWTGAGSTDYAIYRLKIETGEEIKIVDNGMYPYWRWPAEAP
ncbi:MAG: PD40 domain-containing protein [Anaerolineales bacterium]|nr:PD40 domain-containing protein [Anaerolineales bacterium]